MDFVTEIVFKYPYSFLMWIQVLGENTIANKKMEYKKENQTGFLMKGGNSYRRKYWRQEAI